MDCIHLRTRTSSCCVDGNEHFGFIKDDAVRNYTLTLSSGIKLSVVFGRIWNVYCSEYENSCRLVHQLHLVRSTFIFYFWKGITRSWSLISMIHFWKHHLYHYNTPIHDPNLWRTFPCCTLLSVEPSKPERKEKPLSHLLPPGGLVGSYYLRPSVSALLWESI